MIPIFPLVVLSVLIKIINEIDRVISRSVIYFQDKMNSWLSKDIYEIEISYAHQNKLFLAYVLSKRIYPHTSPCVASEGTNCLGNKFKLYYFTIFRNSATAILHYTSNSNFLLKNIGTEQVYEKISTHIKHNTRVLFVTSSRQWRYYACDVITLVTSSLSLHINAGHRTFFTHNVPWSITAFPYVREEEVELCRLRTYRIMEILFAYNMLIFSNFYLQHVQIWLYSLDINSH